jgi:hypothetical protein
MAGFQDKRALFGITFIRRHQEGDKWGTAVGLRSDKQASAVLLAVVPASLGIAPYKIAARISSAVRGACLVRIFSSMDGSMIKTAT